MTDKLDTLISKLQAEDNAIVLTGLEARVWQRLDAARLGARTLFALQTARALPVIVALVLGGTAGARAMTSQNELSVFSAAPAYSILRLVE